MWTVIISALVFVFIDTLFFCGLKDETLEGSTNAHLPGMGLYLFIKERVTKNTNEFLGKDDGNSIQQS